MIREETLSDKLRIELCAVCNLRIRNFGDDFEGVLGMNAYANAKEYDRYEKPVAIPPGI